MSLYYNGKYVLQAPRLYRSMFYGSTRLFNACWRQYREYLNGSIDEPTSDADVVGWLEQIAADKVNDPKSRFYIYG